MGEVVLKVFMSFILAFGISFFVAGIIWVLNRIFSSDKLINKSNED